MNHKGLQTHEEQEEEQQEGEASSDPGAMGS